MEGNLPYRFVVCTVTVSLELLNLQDHTLCQLTFTL